VNGIPIYEFDGLVAASSGVAAAEGLHRIPDHVYGWLEEQCLRSAEEGEAAWLRLTQRRGRHAIQVTSYVGVIRAASGFQIEVLPKVGKAIGGGVKEARELLIEMLRCLQGFRHIQTESAKLLTARMPLLEIFIAEFLRTVELVVKRGLRSDYSGRQDNLFALRGKLLIAPHWARTSTGQIVSSLSTTSFRRTDRRIVYCTRRCNAC
jgi:5-methylcytosine-specific restriction enzyme subunit McrC